MLSSNRQTNPPLARGVRARGEFRVPHPGAHRAGRAAFRPAAERLPPTLGAGEVLVGAAELADHLEAPGRRLVEVKQGE